MAITSETTIQRFIGLSTDTKPAAPIGSFFWAYDTKLMFKCYDGTNWSVYAGAEAIGTQIFTATAGSTTTLTAATLADVAGEYVGQQAVPLQGAMAGEGRFITAYNGTNQITVSPAWAANPAAGGSIEFAVVAGSLGIMTVALGTNGTTVTDSATSVLGAIGANNADNAFSSSSVVANADGSTLEREEYLQAELAKVPKSDSTVSWNATALAAIRTEAAGALAATANKRQVGVKQIFQKVLTTALTNGTQDVTVATVTAQDFDTVSVSLRSNGAQPATLVSVALYAGASKVITLISPADGARANIAAADQQVCWPNPPGGKCTLAATKTFVATLVGTGTDAIDLTFTFGGEACADGGYLA